MKDNMKSWFQSSSSSMFVQQVRTKEGELKKSQISMSIDLAKVTQDKGIVMSTDPCGTPVVCELSL